MGLPTVVGRNKRANLNYIKDRVWENFDASMFDESSEAGIGMVIRNSKCGIMPAFSEKLNNHPPLWLWRC